MLRWVRALLWLGWAGAPVLSCFGQGGNDPDTNVITGVDQQRRTQLFLSSHLATIQLPPVAFLIHIAVAILEGIFCLPSLRRYAEVGMSALTESISGGGDKCAYTRAGRT